MPTLLESFILLEIAEAPITLAWINDYLRKYKPNIRLKPSGTRAWRFVNKHGTVGMLFGGPTSWNFRLPEGYGNTIEDDERAEQGRVTLDNAARIVDIHDCDTEAEVIEYLSVLGTGEIP